MNLPKQAEKKFSGVIFDVYQWEQELFDGSKATFEMLDRPDTVQIIPTIDDKIAISEEEQPSAGKFLSLFGGRVDDGEEPLEAAKRELQEEAGLSSNDWELYSEIEPYVKMNWKVYTYIARNCSRGDRKEDPGEKITIKELSFEEFVETASTDEFRSTQVQIDILKRRVENTIDDFKKRLDLV